MSRSFVENERVLAVDFWRRFDPELFKRLLDTGVRTVITFLGWHETETSPGEYRFDGVLKYLDTATKAGMKVILQPGRSIPYWAPEDWFLKDQYGERNDDRELLENLDTTDFMQMFYDMTFRFPSYWSMDALRASSLNLERTCSALARDNVFFMAQTGVGNEMYQKHVEHKGKYRIYWYDDHALRSFAEFLGRKYHGDIGLYNYVNGGGLKRFDEARPKLRILDPYHEHPVETDFCLDTIEWWTSSVLAKQILDVSILKGHNPTSEQFMNNIVANWSFNEARVSYLGLDPLEIVESMREKVGIETIHHIRWEFHDPCIPPWERLESYWATRKRGYQSWSGAEGPANILANTRHAIRFGQRGFVCGLRSWESIDDWRFGDIEKSIALLEKYGAPIK